MQKIAIYDFCQTLVDFETADEFIHFIQKNKKVKRMEYIENIRKILEYAKILINIERVVKRFNRCYSVNKHIILSELRGFKKPEIDTWAKRYYEEVIKYHLIEPMLNQLISQKKDGFIIVIVSASYEPFLKLFKDEFGIDYLITNKFLYNDNDVFMGRLTEPDCVGENKVKRFFKEFPDFNKNNYDICISYGDSKSDVPILKVAKRGIVISNGQDKKWIKCYELEELKW